MPIYKYRAKNILGQEISGSYEATDKAAVIYMLREKNFYPVNIKEDKSVIPSFSIKKLFKKVTLKDLAVFCRQFSTMINAGVPILSCLDILRKQTENIRLKETLETIYGEVQKGKSLSQVMGEFRLVFPELLINMIETGEIGGNLDKVLERMASHYEKEYKINQKVKNALTYPAIIAIVAILVIIFLVTVVVPTFASMFSSMGAILPISTRILMKISDFVKNSWYLFLVAFILGRAVLKSYSQNPQGREKIDNLKLILPVIGNLHRNIATARFARTLGSLMNSGISVLQGIEVTKKVIDNQVISRSLTKVAGDVKKGKGLAEPLREFEVFPPMLVHMVKIGEDTGTLDFILEKTADFYDDEVENALNKMTTVLEPAIIVIMAVIVSLILISVLLPMFDIMTQVNF